jgi:uncharacterized protein
MSVPAVSASRLEPLVATLPSVLIGYSGGVDSALLAVVARRTLGKGRSVAALGVSPSLSRVQHDQARAVAGRFDLNLVEIATRELDDPGYTANAPDRCYFCKRELWDRLTRLAEERGLAVVADGTNADDTGDHRPGLRAAAERAIRSPLAEAGYTKADVRREARALGVPIWDAPAAPCLSSRILYGLSVTPDRLRQVEAGEAFLRSLGVTGDLRVRHRDLEARIEVQPHEQDRVRRAAAAVRERFEALGFDRVTLDLDGYRRGSLLRHGAPNLEVLGQRA